MSYSFFSNELMNELNYSFFDDVLCSLDCDKPLFEPQSVISNNVDL